MATTGGERVFIDTNVLIRANARSAPLHVEALQAIEVREQAGIDLWISRQVLREYLAVLTRPQAFTAPIAIKKLAPQVRLFETHFFVAAEGPSVTAQLLSLLESIPAGGKQIHDTNIVATMLVHGVRQLVTHNPDDFARFAHLITVVPLGPPPPPSPSDAA